MKMLYEKILSMDHHFSSLKAQQELMKISNPHNYPDFKESISTMEDKMKRKYNFTLPGLLQGIHSCPGHFFHSWTHVEWR
ncbi:MAG: hypothetical protein R2778_15065 [Saprospiraceae bacterium]